MACNETAAEVKHMMEASQTAVEIKIKTLDSQVYTCRVEKNVSVPDLKEQVALVTGVPSGSQRLICRGKVLKDEHALSAYEVEDGHTLHLVTRPAPPPSVSAASTEAQSEEQESHDYYNRPGHISHSVLVGTFNFPDHRNAAFSELNRILSSLLSSLRVGSYFPPTLGAGNGNSASLQPGANAFNGGQEREHTDQIPEQRINDQATTAIPQSRSNLIDGLSSLRGEAGYVSAMPAVSHVRIVHQVVPNALRTLSQHVDRMERIFAVRNAEQAQVLSSIPNTSAQSPSNAQPHSLSGEDGSPAAWGSMFRRLEELLRNQAASELLRTANQIEAEPSLETPVVRGHLLFSGIILEQLGRLLLDLGGTALTLLTEPSQTGAVSASTADQAPQQGGEPTQYVHNDDTSGNMDIHIHAGLPPFLVARNLLSQATQDGPLLSLNIDGTRDSTINHSEPALNGNLNGFMQPPSLGSMQAPISVHEHRAGSAGVPELFQSSSLLDNTLGSRGVFYPLLARFQQLNSSLLSRQEGLSLETSGSEEGSAVHSFLTSGQHHYPNSLSVLQAVIQNQVGQLIGDGEVGYAAEEQLTPAISLQLEARDTQPETGLAFRSSVQQGFEASTACDDLIRPLLHVLEASPTVPSEREQPISDQEHPNQGMLRKADAETSLQLKCAGQTSLDTEWSCAQKDGSSVSNSRNSAAPLSVQGGEIFSASKETAEAMSRGFSSSELQLSCRTRLERESQDCCRIEDVNTSAGRGTILQDFLSTLACRKEERSSSEMASSGNTRDLSLVFENAENQEFGLDCSGSKAVLVQPLLSPHYKTESLKQKRILEMGLDTLGAPSAVESFENAESQKFGLDCSGSKAVLVKPLLSPHYKTESLKQNRILEMGLDTLGATAALESFDKDAQRIAMEGNGLCGMRDSLSRDEGKGVQQFFPVAVANSPNRRCLSPSMHINEVENGEAVCVDSGRLLKLQQFSASGVLVDKDADDLKRHITDSSFEGLQAVKRQKML